ncbi:hypothetical protein CO668_12345 [Rhizobium anhuiense]|nr:hypothetical protein CO668_12345 [Rhizobium anhuiense]
MPTEQNGQRRARDDGINRGISPVRQGARCRRRRTPADALALGRARQEIKPGRATLLRERALAIKAAKKAKG